eukprot:TRINITY_DN9179_c0_g1_i1.p1 TRINITY_DN9179_c0_g1~~TRINITY_DN9179_c0_g1_i1.p1  ORF type:complete len:420 (+),score=111.85 TRINITY_DN9179_c0_g1_i1:167-1426(+)
MAVSTTMTQAEVEELCASLQAKTRSLEQREMSQMRQHTILQRKVDAAEQSCRECEQQRTQARDAARKRRKEPLGASGNAGGGGCADTPGFSDVARPAVADKAAAQQLETELQKRLEEMAKEVAALEREVQAARSNRRQLEAMLSLDRRYAKELSAMQGDMTAPVSIFEEVASSDIVAADAAIDAKVAAAEERARDKKAMSSQLAKQTAALRDNCDAMRERLAEVERMAENTRFQEQQLRSRNDELAAHCTAAETRAAETVARRAEEERRLVAFREGLEHAQAEVARLQAPAVSFAVQGPATGAERDVETGNGASSGGADRREELSYLRRKVEEREGTLCNLRSKNASLQAALRRHASTEGAHRKKDEDVGDSLCGKFDETVSWMVMLLFKSILVRRFFIVHLALLYTWLFFILWWLSHP